MGQGGQDYGCHIIGNKVYHRRLFDRIAPFSLAQDWDTRPEDEAVLIGTQDQLLSRALPPE